MGPVQAGMRPTKCSQTCMMSVMHRYGYSFVQRNLTQPTACRSHHFTLRYCRNLNSISSYTRPNARNTHLGVPLQLATRPKLLRTAGKANLLLLTVFYCCCSPLFTLTNLSLFLQVVNLALYLPLPQQRWLRRRLLP